MVNEAVSGGSERLSCDHGNKHFVARYSDVCRLGLHGFRRRCLLLGLLAILVCIVILNLALKLWLIMVMEFSSNGLGPLKILPGGLQLRGEAMMHDKLVVSKIRSRKGQAIVLEGSRNISLNARSSSGRLVSQLKLGNNSLEILGSSLKVSDSHGRTLLAVDKKKLLIGSESLVVSGEGGATFYGSLQTPKVKAESGHELRLESPTRSLDILGTFGVNVVSGASDISVLALDDLKLMSQSATVRIEAPNISISNNLPNLETVSLSTAKVPREGASVHATYSTHPTKSTAIVYQLCICQKGRIFLAPSDGECVADNDFCR